MQKLLLTEELFDKLGKGKINTIRLGRRDIALGDLIFESNETGRKRLVNVHSVQYCKLINVQPDTYRSIDGVHYIIDLFEYMKKIYPDIVSGSEVTVISFYVHDDYLC